MYPLKANASAALMRKQEVMAAPSPVVSIKTKMIEPVIELGYQIFALGGEVRKGKIVIW